MTSATGAERIGASATPAYPRPTVAWYTVFVMLLLYICSYMDRQVLTMLVEPIKADLRISDFQLSLLMGPVFAVFYTTLGIPAGWISDRYNRRALIATGAALWAIATAGCGMAGTYAQMAVARLSVGIGEATLTPAAQSMIADQFPPKRLSLALSVYMLGVTFGSGLALGFSGLLIDWAGELGARFEPLIGQFRPWQIVFFIVASPTIILAPLVFTVRETRTRVRGGVPVEPGAAKAFVKGHYRLLTPYYIGFGMTSVAVYALSSWIPAYMSRTFDMSMAQIGVGFGLMMFIATGVGQILWSIVVDWLYDRGVRDAHLRFHMLTWIISAPAVALAFMVDQPLFFLVLLGVFYLFTYPFQGYSIAGLQLVTPPQFRGRMSAAYLTYLNLVGLAAGPTAVGAITDFVFHDTTKVGWAMAIVVLVSAPIGAFFLWIAARQKRAMLSRTDVA